MIGPRSVKVDTVKLADLSPKDRDMVSQAAVDELARSKKRIAELEGQLVTRRGVGFVLSRLVGGAFILTLACVLAIAMVSAGHRLLMWGWP